MELPGALGAETGPVEGKSPQEHREGDDVASPVDLEGRVQRELFSRLKI